jgi:peptidoglycan/LPS O-acetylase OafA/YrhL
MKPTYRADIGGLRAVAVLSILFFHLDITQFSGGYVGVDIFYVISGYLITSIIVRELAAGEFSIARFYERRVRRILPALVVVLIATLLVGSLMLGPNQFAELGRSTGATALFVSNIFFFMGSGYFDGPSELKPLLHTWSLAIEEQFYILFPFLLILIAKRLSGRYATWLIPLAVLSLAASVIGTGVDENAAFFLLPFRGWELLIGSVLALNVIPHVTDRKVLNVLSAAGLMMMLVSIFTFSSATPFPGIAAALPTIGTGLVIYAGTNIRTFVGRMLGARPMVFFGLISYSLYLWHWPTIVYAKLYLINEPTDLEKTVILILTVGLATLSWRAVETPFRDRTFFAPRERLFVFFSAVCVVILASSLFIVSKNGFPGRAPNEQLNDALAADPGWQHWKDCEELGEEDTHDLSLCAIGAESGTTSVLFWGDSHALALASAINSSAMRLGIGGEIAVRTGCAPLIGIDRVGQRSCHEFNEDVIRYLAERPDLGTVILAARWALSTSGTRYKNEDGKSVTLEDVSEGNAASGDNAALFELGLRRTVAALESLGRRVVIVRQVPEVGYDVPSANYSAKLTGQDVNALIAPTRAEYAGRTADSSRVIDALAAGSAVQLVDPASLLCDADTCRVVDDDIPLYRDDNHLSLYGCLLVSKLFDEVLAGN